MYRRYSGTSSRAPQRDGNSPTEQPPRALYNALRLLLVLGAVYLTTRLFWPGPGIAETALGVAALAAGAVWCWRARVVEGLSSGRIWVSLALGQLLWAAAAFYEQPAFAFGGPAGVSPALLLTAAGQLCWIYALLALRRHIRVAWHLTPAADAALALVCAITLVVYFVLAPSVLAASTAPLPLAATLLTVLVLAGLVLLRYGSAEPFLEAHSLALGAILLALLSQGWQLSVIAGGGASSLVDAARIVAGLLFMLAAERALHPPRMIHLLNRWDAAAPWLPLFYLGAVILLPLLAIPTPLLAPLAAAGILSSMFLVIFRLGLSVAEVRGLRQERDHLIRQTEEWTRLAISDPLTGLFNKGYCDYRLKEEFERGKRNKQPLVAIALDLDNFKSVNDRHGHQVGDALLQEIGRAIQKSSRTVDIGCRTGGDEFIVLLPNTNVAAGVILADRLRAVVAAILARRRLDLVGVSAGVAGYPESAPDPEALLRRADRALYQAKAEGKGRTCVWTPLIDPFPVPETYAAARTEPAAQQGPTLDEGTTIPAVH